MFKVFGSIFIIMLIAPDVSLAPEAMPAVGLAASNTALKGDRLDLGRRTDTARANTGSSER